MKIVKSNYENFKKRVTEDILTSPSAVEIKNGNISYFEILNDDESYVNYFKIFDNDDNWLGINVHDKISILDDEEIMKLILLELKAYYSSLVLRISEEFKHRIEQAKLYGFEEKSVKQHGNYNYVELKIEL